MSTQGIADRLQAFVDKAAAIDKKALDVIRLVESSTAAHQIEKMVPGAADFVARMGGPVKLLETFGAVAPQVDMGIAAFELLQQFGKPAEPDTERDKELMDGGN